LPTHPLPEEVDVAIVGGGYTGLNAARVIARNGGSVAVLEQETIGWGASSRNGGMTTTGLKAAAKVVNERYGKQMGRDFWQASLDAIDLVEEIVHEEQIDCDFERRGHVALATKPQHYKQMQAKANWFRRELDHHMEAIGPDELRREIGSDIFYGGLRDEFSGWLNRASSCVDT
jgi:glycine/D-amino acid oxidase-like deaminating enzyme